MAQRATWLADVLREAGLTVVEFDGWRTRGGELRAIHGVVAHHTATPKKLADKSTANLLRDGRPDLRGPLSQLGLDRAGRYWVVAAGRCSHNGYGLWGNDSIGIEAYNDGVGEPWPKVQLDAYVVGAAAILRRIDLGADRFKGHRETDPKRKVDPRGIDLDAARRRIGVLLRADRAPLPIPVPTTEEDDVPAQALIGFDPLPNGRYPFIDLDPSTGAVTIANDLTALDGRSELHRGDRKGKPGGPYRGLTQLVDGDGRFSGYLLLAADGGTFRFGEGRVAA